MNVRGREVSQPYGKVELTEDGGLYIRLDDETNPKFWLTIHLTLDELRAVLDGKSIEIK